MDNTQVPKQTAMFQENDAPTNGQGACCPTCGKRMDQEKKDAAYPWDECIADQMKRGNSKEDAQRICGSIKAKYG